MTAKGFHFSPEFQEKVTTRIANETPGICRVLWDLTSKPPATIELE